MRWQSSKGTQPPPANSSLREVHSFALRETHSWVVAPGLRLLAFEVDADGAPVANEVVEQEPGRPVVLDAVVEEPAEDAFPALLMDVARDLAGLEEEQESSRQVGVRVDFQADRPTSSRRASKGTPNTA